MAFKEVDGNRILHTCDLCGTTFQMGQGLYEGTHLHEVEMTVCGGCGPADKSPRERRLAIQHIRDVLARREE